jgi:hypothetical protein
MSCELKTSNPPKSVIARKPKGLTKQSDTFRYRPERSEGSLNVMRSLVVVLLGTTLRVGLLRRYAPRNDVTLEEYYIKERKPQLVCGIIKKGK